MLSIPDGGPHPERLIPVAKLVTPYSAAGPLLDIRLSTGDTSIVVPALVDSGASRSFFPKTTAALLGLNPDLLERDAQGAVGVEGAGFPTWSSTRPITGQVVRVDPNTGAMSLWGSPFPMNPAFADKEAALLGRSDFFPAFYIGFGTDDNGLFFAIED